MIGSNFVSVIIEKIGIKFDNHKLKKYVDFAFVLAEKISVKLTKFLPHYLEFYEKMVDNEVVLANISKTDKVLHIGCGPIPATSILIAKKTGANVTGIDHNFYSIKQAIACLEQLNFSDKVEVRHAEAGIFPIKQFDLIIVSQGIKPCDTVLDHIAKSMKSGARIIYRTSSTDDGKISKSDMFIKDIYTVSKLFPQKQYGLLLSILLLKKI